MIMKKLLTTLSLVLAFSATSVQAIPLQTLFDGGSITVGDKSFENWNLMGITDPWYTPPIDLSLIEVTGLGADQMNPGLHFEANGQLSVIDDDFLDLWFGFDVIVLDPAMRVKDNSLEITSHNMGAGNFGGYILIEEEIFDAAGAPIDFKDVYVDNFWLDEKLFDSVEFDPMTMIHVEKNILVAGDDFDDIVELISFEQHFSQVEVPEPTTLALLSLGLIGFGVVRSRKA